jgi:dihydrofolate reductase
MRKIISSTYISLDGVIADPQDWHAFNDEAGEYAYNLLFSCGALLMGRRTYESFAESWPNMEEATGDFGVRMNTLPHYVVSDSLENGEWGDTTVIRRDDAVAEIAKLKEQDGQDILQYGFGPVSRVLAEHGLLDELRLWINPVLAGTGDPAGLIIQEGFTARFDLADTRILGNGVIIATYRPVEGAGT